jgi:hypothetical protein
MQVGLKMMNVMRQNWNALHIALYINGSRQQKQRNRKRSVFAEKTTQKSTVNDIETQYLKKHF